MHSRTLRALGCARCVSRQALCALAVSLLAFQLSVFLFAQANTGRILGSVTDQTGSAIVGATVSVTDTARGITRTLSTDSAGAYQATNLTPGTYVLKAEAKGFKTTQRANVLLEVGSELRIDMALQPGTVEETVVVNETVPLVDTTSATLGGTVSNEIINDLPLNGRNYQYLLQLRPGVTITPGGGAWAQSANGVRPESNNYMVDGLLGNDNFSGQSVLNSVPVAGDAATILPIDAIQEFKSEHNPRAEFGWKPGANVNVGLKSGTNSIHGTAYAFGRTDSWDARNYFNTSDQPKVETQLEQFGATFGGPIKKDKLFYFVGFEGQRYTVGSTNQNTAPLTCVAGQPGCILPAGDPRAATLTLAGACQANLAAGKAMAPTSLKLAGLTASCQPTSGSVFPANNGQFGTFVPVGGNTEPMLAFFPNLPSSPQENGGLGKIDYHINEHHTLNGFYYYGQLDGAFNHDSAEVTPAWESLLHTDAQMWAGNWTWAPNSTWVNEFRVGVSHMYQPTYSVDHNVNPTTYGINTGVSNPLEFGFPQISFVGFSGYGLGKSWPKIQGPDTDLQFVDHVSYLHGKHFFKFGGEVIYSKFNGGAFQNAKGNFQFASLQAFLQGNIKKAQLLVGDPIRHMHNYSYAAFLQDDYRITPRLTLNMGLRYELTTLLQEDTNRLGGFDPAKGLIQAGESGVGSVPFNPDHNNFSPRLGFAWDVAGNGKTVVRGGGSIIYEKLSLNTYLALGNLLGIGVVPTGAIIGKDASGNPVTAGGTIQSGSITWSGPNAPVISNSWKASSVGGSTIFPQQALNCSSAVVINGIPGAACNTFAVNPNFATPYVSTWSLGVERQVTSTIGLDLNYVGNHGTKLAGVVNLNELPMGGGTLPYAAKFPYLNGIYQLANRDLSNYDGLQATLTARNFHGLTYVLGYTFAHSLDDTSHNWGGGLAMDSRRPYLEYGPSYWDSRHRFTLSATYDLPSKRGFGHVLEGWQLNSILILESAMPWDAIDQQDNYSGTGQTSLPGYVGERWNFYGNPDDFRAQAGTFIPQYTGATLGAFPQACQAAATAHGLVASMLQGGCYARGSSVMLPPAQGTFGNVSRNMFRGLPFKNWDLSLTKTTKITERFNAQFRAEFFNVLNHPNFANPAQLGDNFDPGNGSFGCSCTTPDQAAQNPVLGNGASRDVQLSLKLIF